ncbi:VanW family protein [Paenibacillus athensensis]|uniref:Vancomycin resistance protein n=1 Tax=Paenibacillus athensensis TaxID=1967502 RepID=A0A4Y8QB96_9BACL|nr:VanW family protein [Paenibacillus athensensis]MCD1257584.1 VanW family protein [Paenibacillus athensensis]
MFTRTLARRFPILYRVRVQQLQWKRRWADATGGLRFASHRQEPLPYVYKKHKSLLRRHLAGSDPQLQENKIVNLGLCMPLIDGVVIRPGETFSLWKLIGRPTAAKGYLKGLALANGEAVTAVGGGLCQLANLLFWLALHTPLTVVERHHHSFDLFPDHGRTVPFGSGTSIFYNYVDLRFYNGTAATFQLHTQLTDEFLVGSLTSDCPLQALYRIEERGHHFEQVGSRWYRENEIWRLTLDAASGEVLGEELLMHNRAEVRYAVSQSGMDNKPAMTTEEIRI